MRKNDAEVEISGSTMYIPGFLQDPKAFIHKRTRSRICDNVKYLQATGDCWEHALAYGKKTEYDETIDRRTAEMVGNNASQVKIPR